MSAPARPPTQVVRLGRLTVTMLRYRAALMVWMFLLLGAAYPRGVIAFELDYLWALVAIGASYICATSINDLADEEIDRVNHPDDPARPLVTGEARRSDLRIVALGSAAAALSFGALIGWRGLGLIAVGLVVAYAYSAPPLILSHRTYLAPLLLVVGYVAVPYLLGATAAGYTDVDARMLGALGCLFLARIVLKDFRDREGDARYGRPTLLLRRGKAETCALSLAALAAGDVALLLALDGPLVLGLLVQLFIGPVAYMLWTLYRASEQRSEQVAIGMGARMGNGLLVAVLGWLLMTGSGAPANQGVAFVAVLTLLYGLNFATLRARPHDVLIGYKG